MPKDYWKRSNSWKRGAQVAYEVAENPSLHEEVYGSGSPDHDRPEVIEEISLDELARRRPPREGPSATSRVETMLARKEAEKLAALKSGVREKQRGALMWYLRYPDKAKVYWREVTESASWQEDVVCINLFKQLQRKVHELR